MRLLFRVVVDALAIGLAAWLMDGISLDSGTTVQKAVTLLVVGAIFGVVTTIVRPIVTLLSLPLVVLTLGLMLLVINALMLMLTSWIADQLDVGFHVDGFWVAVGGSIIISIASVVLEAVLPGPDRN